VRNGQDWCGCPRGAPICETEFSATAKNMVLNWLGMAWLPLSLVKDEIASGQLADLSSLLGQASLAIAFYARPGSTFDAEFVDRAAARLSAS